MKLSTSTSVLIQYTLQDAITLVAEIGYDGIDIWGGRPHVYRRDFNKKELIVLRKLIEGNGLEVSSFMPAFCGYPHSLSNPNLKVRQDSIKYMRYCIYNAAILGAKVVLVVPDHSLFGQSKEESLKRMIESIDIVAKYASQYKLKIGIEMLYFDETDLINTSDDALNIINDLGYKNIGVIIDTGTLNLSKEPPEEMIAKLKDLILQIHINDNKGGEKQQNLIPGEGTYNFKRLIKVLKENGYSGFLSAELSRGEYGDEPVPALRTTLKYLRALLEAK